MAQKTIIIASTSSPYAAGTIGGVTTILVAPGAGSYPLPADFPGVFDKVECWGSGTSGWDYSGGGGGGYSASLNVAVSGATLAYKLAAGGVRDAYNNQGHGDATWALSATAVLADGGDVNYDGGSPAPNTTNGYGATRFNGGNGGADASNLGGGSAATPTGTGAFAPGGTTGAAGADNVQGGAGGAPAGRGGYPGGGGGGGASTGARGNDGQVRLTYTPAPSAAIYGQSAVQAAGKLTQRARTSTLWSPAALGSAVAAWYDFTTGAATLNGAVIIASDKSGNNHGLVAPAGSGAPTPSTAINGLPTVHFGGAQYLYTNAATSILTGSAAAVAGVCTMGSAGSNNGRLISLGAASTADYNSPKYFAVDRNTSVAAIRIEHNGVSYGVRSVAYNTPMLVEAELTATTSQTFVNAVGSGTTALATAPTLAVTEIDVGCRPGPADPGSGDAGEWLVFSRALTADERARVQGYLAWKWGLVASLPAGHAYKAAPPDMGDGTAGRASVAAYGRRVQMGSVTIAAQSVVAAAGGAPASAQVGAVAISCQASATLRGRLIAHAASASTCTASLTLTPKASRPALARPAASAVVTAAGRRIQYGSATISARGALAALARATLVGRSAVQMQGGVTDFGVKPPATRLGQATLATGAQVTVSAKVTRYGGASIHGTVITLPAGRYTASGRVAVSMQSAIARAQQTQRLGSTVQVAATSTVRARATATFKARVQAAISASLHAFLKLPRALQPAANLPRAQISTPAGAPAFLTAVVAQVNTYLGTIFATRPSTPPRVYDVREPTDLPGAADYPMCIAWVGTLSRLVVSNGTNWVRTDTGAVVA